MKYSIHISSLFCGGGGGMLVVEGLTKRFSNGKGIEDVTFTVNKGEVFGFQVLTARVNRQLYGISWVL